MPNLDVRPPVDEHTKSDWTSNLDIVVWLRADIAVPVRLGQW